MKRLLSYAAPLFCAALLLSSCDSTPRERQEAVKNEARKLDTLASTAATKLRVAGRRAARFDSISRARSRQPLDNAATQAFTQQLLGTYADIDQLTVTSVEPAYTQLLRQTRTLRRSWSQRDWDYASAIYKRMNERLKAIRLDLPARSELRIRALQAEFITMESSRDVKDLGDAVSK
ncbi:hypothetical protein HER32_09070 [Hymenobacter sp. BT18]|uniref:hypothetical protein n=1 Tax=Hymenobacter sp. BT18 TaxID=2835648 RepID=UPI00143E3F0B|nr:hypothetical protein [Hymenobacter sp. BT18]QIX61323.1 hypothetical protein HER32_09070 [Hymenobacter sp. BT18]